MAHHNRRAKDLGEMSNCNKGELSDLSEKTGNLAVKTIVDALALSSQGIQCILMSHSHCCKLHPVNTKDCESL